ncbi:MAG TPA: adenine deaminase [Bacteroidia bacterium]|nr:adenine deaminase [Bacteroidia bacterium]
MNKKAQIIAGNIVDVVNRKIFAGSIHIDNGNVKTIVPDDNKYSTFILPGFTDAHIHIESSMLTPYEFARIALTHGTVATISDPHEIANVNGLDGIDYMLENAKDAKLKFHFGAPSCVPATSFETAGAVLNTDAVEELMKRNDIWYLSEMMNYPGVLFSDDEVMKKIALAKKYHKPVDGHAPGLRGADAEKYIKAGITTDHECFTKEEALDKIKFGMKILIREGSAAKNFEALHELISEYPGLCMLCSDDKHPDDLLIGHINQLAARAVAQGHDLMNVLQCACVNPVKHYNLPVGLLQTNDPADFIIVKDLKTFSVLETYINGELVSKNYKSFLKQKTHRIINNFSTEQKSVDDFKIIATDSLIKVIEALDGQLITNELRAACKIENGFAVSDVENDILKLVVVNRYVNKKPAVAFIKNFGLKSGAIASTVAHDSHNVIAAGVSDEEICKAVNLLIENKGGLSVVNGKDKNVLALPIAGLMSDKSCEEIGMLYSSLDKKVKQLGCKLRSPYMTLSFMALLVIPNLKLSDKGLFDGKNFQFTSLSN